MRIGIDARPLIREQRTGIGNYIYELLLQLPKIAPQHDYILYSHKKIIWKLPQECIRRQIDSKFARLPGSFWFLSRVGPFARRDKLDVFWSTASVIPLWVPKNVYKVVTVYDLVWLLYPETMQPTNLWLHRLRAASAIQKSDRIIVISKATAADLMRHFRVSPDRIRLVYPGLSEDYRPQDSLAAAQHIAKKFNVPPRYMAAVATIEPRKNLGLLIRVVEKLKKTGKLTCPLLVAGANGWKNSEFFREVQDSGLTDNDIRFLGYLPEDDLPMFYAGASLFLFPSLYEGFGLPPVEAMASGTPVIASNAQPMPEVLADAAILEPPTSPERFAEAITRVLTNETLHSTLRERGLKRAEAFRREQSARQFLDAVCVG
jgi:glycosyltransferase involved in cell wall biosynthesis